MEFILELIFEILGGIIESIDSQVEVESLKKKSRKWIILMHVISVGKIIFCLVLTLLMILFVVSEDIEGSQHPLMIRIICGALAVLFLYVTISSIKKYSGWKEKIRDMVEDKKSELVSEDVYDMYDGKTDEEWLSQYYKEDK